MPHLPGHFPAMAVQMYKFQDQVNALDSENRA